MLMSLAKRPREELAVARARRESFEAEIAKLQANKPDASDFGALLTHRQAAQALEGKLALAREVEAFKRAEVANAAAAAAERDADAKHTALRKVALEGSKLTLEIAADNERLAAKLARLEALRKEIEEGNAVRGKRDFIVDGEAKARQTPASTRPAVYEEQEKWVDAAGNTPGQLAWDAKRGEYVPADHGVYAKKSVKVQIQAEQFNPAAMPTRFASAIQLVDLSGRRIWPR